MIFAYLKDRYGYSPSEELMDEWNHYMIDKQKFKTDKGFITYKLEGDSVIIYDLYIKPEFRDISKATYANELHDYVIDLARKEGKKVAIGFSQLEGRNHMEGIRAMKAVGFYPSNRTNKEFVFIKGI